RKSRTLRLARNIHEVPVVESRESRPGARIARLAVGASDVREVARGGEVSIRRPVTGSVEVHEPLDFGPLRLGQQAVGDGADDLVAVVAPGGGAVSADRRKYQDREEDYASHQRRQSYASTRT